MGGRSPSASPPRRGRGGGGRDRSRSRGRGGGGGGVDVAEWGTAGIIVDLKPSGFGFIRPDTGKVDDKDLYFHSSTVVKPHTFDSMRLGDIVTYTVGVDERRNQATAKDVC